MTMLVIASLLASPVVVADDTQDIPTNAQNTGEHDSLVAALAHADLVTALQADGPFTVFAPTDAAFAKLPKGTVETLLKPENKSKLVDILTYHVVSGSVPAKTAVTLNKATALNKKAISLGIKGDSLYLNGNAKVIKADVNASNGVIHVLDNVILPPASKG